MTYDGHDGIDFGITDYAAMDAGVAVLAAAAGEVTALRDGEPDWRGTFDGAAVAGRECGNGVVIDHGGGLVTQYCHLRAGSVRVHRGQSVAAGDPIGMVGQSGMAAFPHVHFEIRRDGRALDPFSGHAAEGCALEAAPLWTPEAAAALPYFAGLPYHLGFAPGRPDAEAMHAGAYDGATLAADAEAIVFWVEMWGVAAGDTLAMTITAPDGSVLLRDGTAIDRTQAYRYRFAGVPASGPWPPGPYTGRAVYTRAADGHVWEREAVVQVATP
ncbi:MAG: M23 family metallopeptidase, partial [Rhodospirillaceae bacterium]|nr:M23 family metallopeptidase [Rhodospirillaceae bacterium]